MHVPASFLHAKDSVLCNTYLHVGEATYSTQKVCSNDDKHYVLYMYSDGEGRNNTIGWKLCMLVCTILYPTHQPGPDCYMYLGWATPVVAATNLQWLNHACPYM